jgi:hypothetical protein
MFDPHGFFQAIKVELKRSGRTGVALVVSVLACIRERGGRLREARAQMPRWGS